MPLFGGQQKPGVSRSCDPLLQIGMLRRPEASFAYGTPFLFGEILVPPHTEIRSTMLRITCFWRRS